MLTECWLIPDWLLEDLSQNDDYYYLRIGQQVNIFSFIQIFELMGDNRDKDKEASKNLNSDAESDILKKIDLAFQVN